MRVWLTGTVQFKRWSVGLLLLIFSLYSLGMSLLVIMAALHRESANGKIERLLDETHNLYIQCDTPTATYL